MDVKIGETEYTLGEGITIIGRGQDADLVIDSGRLSRTHARMTIENEQIWIEDLGSKNGVFVAGSRIADKTELKAGQEIKIADLPLVLPEEAVPAAIPGAAKPPASAGKKARPRKAAAAYQNLIIAGIVLVIAFIVYAGWPESAALTQARKTVTESETDWARLEDAMPAATDDFPDHIDQLEELISRAGTVPAEFPELYRQAQAIRDEARDYLTQVRTEHMQRLHLGTAEKALAEVRQGYASGLMDRPAAMRQLALLSQNFADTPTAAEMLKLLRQLKSEELNEARTALQTALTKAEGLAREKKYGEGLTVLNQALAAARPEGLEETIDTLEALTAELPVKAEKNFAGVCRGAWVKAESGRYDEARGEIRAAYGLMGMEALTVSRDQYLVRIDALREAKIAAARKAVEKDLNRAGALMQAYKFGEAVNLYADLIKRTDSPELKQEIENAHKLAALNLAVLKQIISMINKDDGMDLAELGTSTGRMRNLTETGFEVEEEGASLPMPWARIAPGEYSKLIHKAAATQSLAALLAGMRLQAGGDKARALIFIQKAGAQEPGLKKEFPRIFEDALAMAAEVAMARRQAEEARRAEIARRKEENRKRMEELQRMKQGAIMTLPSGEQIQIFPSDNPWNRDISKLEVHERNADYIATIGPDVDVYLDLSIPYCIVGKDQAKVPLDVRYTGESDPGPYPVPDDAPVEGGPRNGQTLIDWQRAGSGDRHVLVIDKDNLLLYEMFSSFKTDKGWRCSSAAIFDLTSNKLRSRGWTSADAAGLPIFPGLVRYDEAVEKGEIRHALRFTVPRTQRGYILPATHQAGRSNDSKLPPMGLRMRLKADYEIKGFPKPVATVLRAMKTYGIILADNGSALYITGAPHPKWNHSMMHAIRKVKVGDLEAVETGKIQR